jgi:hypothetical protein
MRGRFDVQRHLPRFVTAGQPFQYTLSIQNHLNRPCNNLYLIDTFEGSNLTYHEFLQQNASRRPSKTSMDQRSRQSHWPDLLGHKQGAPKEPHKYIDLQPGEAKNLRLDMFPLRRGRIRLSGVSLARPDPLGLCYAHHLKLLPKSTQQDNWQLASAPRAARSCTIAHYLKGKDRLLKLPAGAYRVDNLKVKRAEINEYGAVRVRGDSLMRYTAHFGMA